MAYMKTDNSLAEKHICPHCQVTKNIPGLTEERLQKIKTATICGINKKSLFALGFIRLIDMVGEETCGSINIYVHPEWKLVVKRIIISNSSNPPQERVPTVFLQEHVGPNSFFVIQPLVDISKEARQQAEKELLNKYHSLQYDLHEYNVGLYEGKSVFFDW